MQCSVGEYLFPQSRDVVLRMELIMRFEATRCPLGVGLPK